MDRELATISHHSPFANYLRNSSELREVPDPLDDGLVCGFLWNGTGATCVGHRHDRHLPERCSHRDHGLVLVVVFCLTLGIALTLFTLVLFGLPLAIALALLVQVFQSRRP